MAVTIHSDGYASNYSANNVREYAKRVAAVLPSILEATGAQAVVVTGNSGISIAMAALMLIEFPLVLVRKESDNSHGQDVEGVLNLRFTKYIVLDDFVSSGRTVNRVIAKLNEYGGGAECVGVLQYRDAIRECSSLPRSVRLLGTDTNALGDSTWI